MLGVLAIGLVFGGSLWQKQVLSVEASVQVLVVNPEAIPFGSVYPGENLSETYKVGLTDASTYANYFTSLLPVDGSLDLCPLLQISSIDAPAEGDALGFAQLKKPDDTGDAWQVRFSVPALKGRVAQGHDGEVIIESGDYACKIKIIVKTIEGCTAGYWKQKQHFDSWVSYAYGQKFSEVFENAFPGKTLSQALALGGGGLNALGRQTVAALLSSANSGVNYEYSSQEVVNMFNGVYPGTNSQYNQLKDKFEKANEHYCPLR